MDGPTRWVIVDDTNSDINYLGRSWFSDERNWNTVGSFGMPYQSTLHGTSSNASFTFSFTGSAVAVVGSSLGSKTKYWNCSVDGVAAINDVGTLTPICTSPCNNYLLCYATALDDGPHTLTVSATPTTNQTFWFDRIEYVPSQEVSLEQKAIRVTPWDSALIGSRGKVFTFYGVSVSWYGTLTSLFNGSAFNLSWSMDQGDSNYTWDWRGNSVSNAPFPLVNQRLFETAIYPMGMHTLHVTDTVGFNYLIVQNGTLLSGSTSESSSSDTTSFTTVPTSGIPEPTPSRASRAMTSGIIAGGVTGSVIAFGIAVLVFYFCRRRSQRRTESYSDKSFFDYDTAHPSLPPQTHAVQRKSRIFFTPSQTNELSEPSTPVTNERSAHDIGDHGFQPQPILSSAEQDVAVDVGRGNQPHISLGSGQLGVVSHTPVVHLPPEYTPN